MSKTAEEILRKHEPVLFDKDLGVQDMVTVICAMNEFAAQEVEAYKERLRKKADDLLDGPASNLAGATVEIMKALIDAVK